MISEEGFVDYNELEEEDFIKRRHSQNVVSNAPIDQTEQCYPDIFASSHKSEDTIEKEWEELNIDKKKPEIIKTYLDHEKSPKPITRVPSLDLDTTEEFLLKQTVILNSMSIRDNIPKPKKESKYQKKKTLKPATYNIFF